MTSTAIAAFNARANALQLALYPASVVPYGTTAAIAVAMGGRETTPEQTEHGIVVITKAVIHVLDTVTTWLPLTNTDFTCAGEKWRVLRAQPKSTLDGATAYEVILLK